MMRRLVRRRRAMASLLTIAGIMGWLLAGCGADDGSNANDKQAVPAAMEKQEPVTVQIGITESHIVEDQVQELFIDPVKKKYPYITVEIVPTGGAKAPNGLANLVASNQLPDILDTNTTALENTKVLGIQYDMTEVIKKNNFDLNRFIPETLQTVKTNNFTDYLIGFPFYSQPNVMYYNKDIFDKFGAAYPKDGMTWEQAADLTKKLTRMEGGVQYRGFEPDTVSRAGTQLSLPLIDPQTHKSVLEMDSWHRLLQLWNSIYEIPGNEKPMAGSAAQIAFVKDRNIAMYAGQNLIPRLDEVKQEWSNWDLAEFPQFAEKPGIGPSSTSRVLTMSPVTKHQDAAFKVMTAVLSDEVQKLIVQHEGFISVLQGTQFQQDFGKDIELLNGKHVQAIVMLKPAKPVESEYNGYAVQQLDNLVKSIVQNHLDINTATRQYNESMDKYVQEQSQ